MSDAEKGFKPPYQPSKCKCKKSNNAPYQFEPCKCKPKKEAITAGFKVDKNNYPKLPGKSNFPF